MQKMKLTFSFLLIAGMFTLSFLGCQKGSQDPSVTSNAKPTPAGKLDKPILSCGSSTQFSINLNVCAGPSGAQAGFSLQWMTAADYAANGNQWYPSEDPRLCHASFSGNANNSRYNLGANECVSVNIGDLLFDNGTSTNCPDELACGTAYIFRSFAHNVPQGLAKSDWSANRTCSTQSCTPPENGCSFSQGYWFANGGHSWPGTVTLGGHTYTQSEGAALWSAYPAGSGGSALKCFYQAAAIILSSPDPLPQSVQDDVDLIDAELAGLSGKLTTSYHPSLSAAAVAAAGRISDWILNNHCPPN